MKLPNCNRKMALEARLQIEDGAGGWQEGWQTRGTVYVELRPRTGREARRTGDPVSRAGYHAVLRAYPVGHPLRPRPDDVLSEGPRRFRIHAVIDLDPYQRFLRLDVTEELVQ